ncbi:MAG: hypothetical protein GTN81_04210 [Proteobacteria bacterium]|nr:hypothetical protein [Pseudomonadota bacterium]
MGFAELIEAIGARGKEEKERIISRSEETAKRLVKEAETRAKEIAESILEEDDPELEAARTRILGETELRKKRSSTEVKNQVVQEVFEKANETLSKIRNRGDYGSILEKLGAEVLVEEDLIVRVDERDVPLMKKILTSRGSNAEVRSGRSCLGGLIVERKNGSVSVHNTFESRLEKQRESLVEEVNRILFRGE